MAQDLVVVMPVFEDAAAFKILLSDMKKSQPGAYICAVDDGSVHEPIDDRMIADAGLSGCVIKLRRNVGHQHAIAIGLNHVANTLSSGSIVVMDSDGEDAPSSISDLLAGLSGPNVDIVVAQRRERSESLKFKVFYAFYKRLFRLLSGKALGFGNFMAIKGEAAPRLTAMPETWTHFAASAVASRLRIKRIEIDRSKRYAGESKMNFVGLALHGFRSLMVFSEAVLVRMGLFFAVLTGVCFMAVASAVGLKLSGFATPGWLTTITGLSILIVLQSGAMTLMMLLTSGVFKTVSLTAPKYEAFIQAVQKTGTMSASAPTEPANRLVEGAPI